MSACLPDIGQLPGAPWAYSDVRILASAREEGDPAPDLIAGYVRQAGNDLQIRVDLLDLPLEPDVDLYFALDVLPGGNPELPVDAPTRREWDWLVSAPARGQPVLLQAIPKAGAAGWKARSDVLPRILRDPWNDFIVVSMNSSNLQLPAGFTVQAFLAPPGERTLSDSLPEFHSQAQPPARARALLAFWNAFPAYTPAQALRRWDGAHTGPLGGRHGLHVLLQAAKRSGIPLVLLDLKTAASLSALDTVGGLNLVESMLAAGLLELPDVLPGWPGMEAQAAPVLALDPEQAAVSSRQAGLAFDLPAGRFLYAPRLPDAPLAGYRAIFTPLATASPQRWQQTILLPIPLPDPGDPQASPDGLTLGTRRLLLHKALSGDSNPVLLGGDFSQSMWGAAPAAEPSLRYLAAHPWMQVMSGDEIAGWRLAGEWKGLRLEGISLPGIYPQASAALAEAGSQNPLAGAAFQSALALQAPLPPQAANLLAMRAGYNDLPGGLLAGSEWARAPYSRSDCSSDPDLDGAAKCILASADTFALLDLDGGRLVFLCVRDPEGVHQVIAPGAQFIAGLSDPSEWQPGAGAASDPGALPGAFSDPRPWTHYLATAEPKRIVLTSPDGSVTKQFTLIESGLEVVINSPGPASFQIPIALDPWMRYLPDWSQRYSGKQVPDRIIWSLQDGPQVEIQSSGFLSYSAFNDLKAEPPVHEDPNFDYPPGQYLPFPLAVVGIEAGGELKVSIVIK